MNDDIPTLILRDEYMEAWRENQIALERSREAALARRESPEHYQTSEPDLPAYDWRLSDAHLLAAPSKDAAGFDPETLGTLYRRLEDERPEWLLNKERSQREVRMLEKLGEPVPEDLRRQADEPDNYRRYERMRAAWRERRARVWAGAWR